MKNNTFSAVLLCTSLSNICCRMKCFEAGNNAQSYVTIVTHISWFRPRLFPSCITNIAAHPTYPHLRLTSMKVCSLVTLLAAGVLPPWQKFGLRLVCPLVALYVTNFTKRGNSGFKFIYRTLLGCRNIFGVLIFLSKLKTRDITGF
jgi:hypothetical protein